MSRTAVSSHPGPEPDDDPSAPSANRDGAGPGGPGPESASPEGVEPERATPDGGKGGKLKNSLSNRHVTMIALGGIIGAGLFVGSGPVINATGPAVILSYVLSGILMVFVMRAIGEMAVARPSQGSLAEYPRLALGNWAGFSVGWLYWYFWVIVAAIEAVAGAGILVRHVPSVPSWLLCLGLLVVMTAINLFSVKMYAETEFWFASIKIVAIVVFLGICAFYLSGLWTDSPGASNLVSEGGFFPHGVLAAVIGSITVMFSMGGAEIATIAAAESKEPAKYAGRATRQVMVRVFFFYVASITLIVLVIPWNITDFTGEGVQSPFSVALAHIGVPFTSVAMEIVVMTAVLSSLNSCLYITSRMLFALSRYGDAPKQLTRVNKRGVPTWAILAGTSGGYVAVIFNYFFPEQLFVFLINSSGAIMLIYYIILLVAQIRMRKHLMATDPKSLTLKMWFFPYLSYVTVAWMVAVLGLMVWIPETRLQVGLSFLSLAAVLIAFLLRRKFGRTVKSPRLSDTKVTIESSKP